MAAKIQASLSKTRKKLVFRWQRLRQTLPTKISTLSQMAVTNLFNLMARVHQALVTDAGLIIVIFAPFFIPLTGLRLAPQTISWLLLPIYVAMDLVRITFYQGASVSLGFTLILISLLTDSPFSAVWVGIFGSLVSEFLRSGLLQPRLPRAKATQRAFFYAGHHAMAGFAAAVVYLLVYNNFERLLGLEAFHLQAVTAFILIYALVSQLLVWPHDRWVNLLLVPDEQTFVRIEPVTTLMMVPLPLVAYYLYNLNLENSVAKAAIILFILPPFFLLLFYMARSFAKTEEERQRLHTQKTIRDRLGSPVNTAEVIHSILTLASQLLGYQNSAFYSLTANGNQFDLRGWKHGRNSAVHCTPGGEEGVKVDGSKIIWPRRIAKGSGLLGKLAIRGGTHFVEEAHHPRTLFDPLFPRRTAIIVLPIQIDKTVIGFIVLVRSKRLFNRQEMDKGTLLTNEAGHVLRSVQRHEQELQNLYEKVESYAKDPEITRRAIQELLDLQVNVAKILTRISEYSFRSNLDMALAAVIGRDAQGHNTLSSQALEEIYRHVRDETPGMPSPTPLILEKLKQITSSLSLSFSFRYQWPDVHRGDEFKVLYELLQAALKADEVSQIISIPQIDMIKEIGDMLPQENLALRQNLQSQLTGLAKCVKHLQQSEAASESQGTEVQLLQALNLLYTQEKSVESLEDPERFIFTRILAGWSAIITKTLQAMREGSAQIRMSLRADSALFLEEVTVCLILENQGSGPASSVRVELFSDKGYSIEQGQADLGMLPPGQTREVEFVLKPTNPGSLRLQFRVLYSDFEKRNKEKKFADLFHLHAIEKPAEEFVEIKNPYTPGPPLKPGSPLFMGRDDVFEFIEKHASRQAHKYILILTGARRTGKTSIIKQLDLRLSGKKHIPVYIDCQSVGIDPGLDNFLLKLAELITDSLEREGIQIEGLTQAEIKDRPQWTFERQFLPRVWEQIGDRRLLMALDEFEELEDRVLAGRLPAEIFSYLRHLMQHSEKMAFIFIGAHRMRDLTADYWSVLFNIAKPYHISFLHQDAAIRLLTEPVKDDGMVFDDLAMKEILRVTAGHPYFLQLMGDALVELCNEQERYFVTIQDARDVMDNIIDAGRIHLTYIWQQSKREAKLVLATLATLLPSGERVTVDAIADRLNTAYQVSLQRRQIIQAMEKLALRDIVQEIPINPISYDFTAQLFGHWLRKYKPLSKVIEEVNSQPTSDSMEPAPSTEDQSIMEKEVLSNEPN